MISNAQILEKEMNKIGIPVISRDVDQVWTHHLWIEFETKDTAYKAYKNLEKNGILVNYRLLPYNIGYGLRLGTNCATIQGLAPCNIPQLAQYFSEAISGKYANENIRAFIREMILNSKYMKQPE